jgi:hypothetical protein
MSKIRQPLVTVVSTVVSMPRGAPVGQAATFDLA